MTKTATDGRDLESIKCGVKQPGKLTSTIDYHTTKLIRYGFTVEAVSLSIKLGVVDN